MSINQHVSEDKFSIWDSFCVAFSLYSVIPMPHTRWTPNSRKYAFCFFPLIGIVIAGAIFIWYRICHSLNQPMIFAAGAAAIPVLLSGGIHMDGFCDVADALGANTTPERSLEIMKDSCSGAFAVMSCVFYGLFSFVLWNGYINSALPAALLIFVLSRSLSGMSVLCIPRARKDGLAADFAQSAHKNPVVIVLALYTIICIAVMLCFAPLQGILCAIGVGVFFYAYSGMIRKRFGGVTGDCAGWFLVIAEMIGLASFVLFGGGAR